MHCREKARFLGFGPSYGALWSVKQARNTDKPERKEKQFEFVDPSISS
jgi:hypothetical protein